jgi:hypothetical protein
VGASLDEGLKIGFSRAYADGGEALPPFDMTGAIY